MLYMNPILKQKLKPNGRPVIVPHPKSSLMMVLYIRQKNKIEGVYCDENN